MAAPDRHCTIGGATCAVDVGIPIIHGSKITAGAVEWQGYEAFAAWAEASGYKPELQLDRINNDGPYSPDNCRWVTAAENARNRRDNRRYDFFGESMVIQDAATRFGLSPATLTERIDRGIAPDLAVSDTTS